MKVKKQSKSLKKIIPENIKYFIKYVIVMPLIESEARHSFLNICRIIIGNYIRKTDIIFYDRFSNHYSFTKPIIDEVSKVKKTILIVGEPSHKLITHNTNKNIKVYYVSNKYQLYLKYLNTKVFVTVASGFENKFKPKKPICIHIFHSIVSMHLVYGLSSFDAYDVFFAVGPHHVNEFNALAKSRKWYNKTFLCTL